MRIELKIVDDSKVVGQTIEEAEKEYNIKIKAHQPSCPCVCVGVNLTIKLCANWYVQFEGVYENAIKFANDAVKKLKKRDVKP